jgi:subfamily B ATP-binding cassette protein HlyB/CyaB
MSTGTGNASLADPGLSALVMLLRFHGLGADPEQIRHHLGAATIGIPEMLCCAKELGLKAQSRLTTWERLVNTPLPCIVALRDGGFLLLGKVAEGKALVQSPLSPRPSMMTRADFEAAWNGHAVMMTRRAGLVDLTRRFDIIWFLGAFTNTGGFSARCWSRRSSYRSSRSSRPCSFRWPSTRCWCIARSARLMC